MTDEVLDSYGSSVCGQSVFEELLLMLSIGMCCVALRLDQLYKSYSNL